MFRIETERLTIRPWEKGDRPHFVRFVNDPEVTRFIHRGVPFTDEEIDAAFARHARNLAELGVCMGAVVERSSGSLVGVAGIQLLGTTGDYELGWVFARETWGKGYATEAGRASMEYVFDVLKKPRVTAIIDPANTPSIRVAERLGMSLVRPRCTGAELGHRDPGIVVDLWVRERESPPAS